MINKGFDLIELNKLESQLTKSGKNYVLIESEDNSDDFKNFMFIGKHEDRDVIYDAAIYTLKVQHHSEVYEIAENEAAMKFPDYQKFDTVGEDVDVLNELDEEVGLFMAEVMEEIEDEERVKVQEHIDVDINNDFGIGLDVGLNIVMVDDVVISDFIEKFNNGEVKLDSTFYAFQLDHDMD